MAIKEQYEQHKLNELCNSLTWEITDLCAAEDKLKLAYVLMHIIEESQKALSEINTDNFITELDNKIKSVCEKSEKQKEALATWFSKDEQMRELINGTNDEFQILYDDIKNKLEQLDQLIKQFARIRENMKLEEVKRTKQK